MIEWMHEVNLVGLSYLMYINMTEKNPQNNNFALNMTIKLNPKWL